MKHTKFVPRLSGLRPKDGWCLCRCVSWCQKEDCWILFSTPKHETTHTHTHTRNYLYHRPFLRPIQRTADERWEKFKYSRLSHIFFSKMFRRFLRCSGRLLCGGTTYYCRWDNWSWKAVEKVRPLPDFLYPPSLSIHLLLEAPSRDPR